MEFIACSGWCFNSFLFFLVLHVWSISVQAIFLLNFFFTNRKRNSKERMWKKKTKEEEEEAKRFITTDSQAKVVFPTRASTHFTRGGCIIPQPDGNQKCTYCDRLQQPPLTALLPSPRRPAINLVGWCNVAWWTPCSTRKTNWCAIFGVKVNYVYIWYRDAVFFLPLVMTSRCVGFENFQRLHFAKVQMWEGKRCMFKWVKVFNGA